MQRHGLIVADNGSNWYFTGTSEPGWDTALVDQLKTIPAGASEAVDTSSLMADPNSGRVAPAGAPAPTSTTAAPATTTTTRPKPKPTTTTARPQPKPTTTSAAVTPEPTTAITGAPESPTTTSTTELAAPVAIPDGRAVPGKPSGRARPWWLTLPALGLGAGAIALRRRR